MSAITSISSATIGVIRGQKHGTQLNITESGMEIRPEDLFHKCSACAGTGKIALPGNAGGGEAEVTIGTRCDRCDGRGLMLTDTGTVLRAFYQMLQDGKF
jgi:hypothetical protein